MINLTAHIKSYAHSLGFFRTGIAQAEKLDGRLLDEWLRRGYHGDMAWMQNRRDLRLDPAALVPNAKSVIVCAMNYFSPEPPAEAAEQGRFARYCRGNDYHVVLKARLKKLLAFIQQEIPQANGRVFVDSAPIMEKVWAVRAGIGGRGKNGLVISPECGSWFFLGEVIVDVELELDAPFSSDLCGACTACMDACPTRAIVEPQVVDARRCISYLTIELNAEKLHPPDLAKKMSNHIFGCDICQEVCPWNKRFARATEEPVFQPRRAMLHPCLHEYSEMSAVEFDRLFSHSPVKRAGLDRLKRNVHTAFANHLEAVQKIKAQANNSSAAQEGDAHVP